MKGQSYVNIGFTGTRQFLSTELKGKILFEVGEVMGTLDNKGLPFIIYTGSCTGVDALIVRNSKECWGAENIVVVPDLGEVGYGPFFDRDSRKFSDQVVYMPKKEGGEPYRIRNEYIVGCSNILIAVPEYEEKHGSSGRSGTWMTVRIARKKGIPIHVIGPLCYL